MVGRNRAPSVTPSQGGGGEDDVSYLMPSFDPTKLTKPQLRSILASHGVTDLPSASAKKEVLIELFTRHITAKANEIQKAQKKIKPSEDGISFLDQKSRPSPSPRRARSKSRLAASANGNNNSLPSSIADSPTKINKTKGRRSRSIIKSPSRSRSRTPARLENLLMMLQSAAPRYSDTPQSATVKLHDRLEFIASANKYTKARSVISPLPDVVKEKHSISPSWTKTIIHSIVTFISFIIPVIRIIFIGMVTISFIFYIRWKYLNPFPYCDSSPSSNKNSNNVKNFNNWRLVDLPQIFNDFCIKCPIYGICQSGDLVCQEGYLPRRNLFMWGSSCVPDRRKLSLVDDIVGKLRYILSQRAGESRCHRDKEPQWGILGEDQLASLIKSKYPLAEWNGIQFDNLFRLAIHDLVKNANILGIEYSRNPLDGKLILHSLSPRITLGCRVKVYLQAFFDRNRRNIYTILGASTILLVAYLHFSHKRRTSRRINELVQSVIQILAEQSALNRRDPTIPSALSIHQIRDALFYKCSSRKKTRLWPQVCKAILRNTNVRETVMSIRGEEHRVWEWIGSDVLSPLLNINRQS